MFIHLHRSSFLDINGHMRSRLDFLDKLCYDRANSWFHSSGDEKTTEGETNFLLSILDSGKHFDEATVHNAINFARSWAELGRMPSRQVLTRILYLSFLSPVFVTQMVSLSALIPSSDWIFRGLLRITKQDFPTLSASIENNAPIWHFLGTKIMADAMSKPIDYEKTYFDRDEDCCFLVEALVLAWPFDGGGAVTYSALIETVARFCIDAKSMASMRLLGALCWVFPRTAAPIAVPVVGSLPAAVVCLLLEMGRVPREAQVGKEFGLKALKFSKKVALEAVRADPKEEGKKAALEVIERFSEKDQTIRIS
jgi:hypothetical protein